MQTYSHIFEPLQFDTIGTAWRYSLKLRQHTVHSMLWWPPQTTMAQHAACVADAADPAGAGSSGEAAAVIVEGPQTPHAWAKEAAVLPRDDSVQQLGAAAAKPEATSLSASYEGWRQVLSALSDSSDEEGEEQADQEVEQQPLEGASAADEAAARAAAHREAGSAAFRRLAAKPRLLSPAAPHATRSRRADKAVSTCIKILFCGLQSAGALPTESRDGYMRRALRNRRISLQGAIFALFNFYRLSPPDHSLRRRYTEADRMYTSGIRHALSASLFSNRAAARLMLGQPEALPAPLTRPYIVVRCPCFSGTHSVHHPLAMLTLRQR